MVRLSREDKHRLEHWAEATAALGHQGQQTLQLLLAVGVEVGHLLPLQTVELVELVDFMEVEAVVVEPGLIQ